MSTFDGIIREFPSIRVDNFSLYPGHDPPLACFLSHVHSDHLRGLESFKSTFVYCTAQTRELLLRLEKYPHRMNFAKGILESRKQTYRRLKNHIKTIPLETPVVIELAPGNSIRVTLFDANHCLGACMFLIQGQGRSVLYTGDIRSEQWWVDSLIRNPVLLPFTKGTRRLDNIYLDTTFTSNDALEVEFPSKAEGLDELIQKVLQYPADTIFYLNTWTFGYEEVWVALSAALDTRVHLDDYRWRLYHSQRDQPSCFGPQTASLVGFELGNHEHPGCLSNSLEHVRIHSCERGTGCEIFKNRDVVRITPIIARHKGNEIAEVGAGGGQGDLNQTHSLELYDQGTIQQLLELCTKAVQAQPQLRSEVVDWFSNLLKKGRDSIDLDINILREEVWNVTKTEESPEDIELENLPIDQLIPALIKLITSKTKSETDNKQNNQITFPYSRHSSYQELRELVQAFNPKDVYPCTVDHGSYTTDVSMEMLFGDLCSSNVFQADMEIQTELGIYNHDRHGDDESQRETPPPEDPAKTTAKVNEDMRLEARVTNTNTKLNAGIEKIQTPQNRGKRPASGGDTPPSARSKSSARRTRAWNAALGLDGQKWEGLLTSVSGYHNQEPEQEL